ncbi:hypothetical protein M407DRAFT_159598 [Tulasnella calospora MUT 4182]|uniref:Uncharacterized protein n=1 Tax=Tulasnella calospora MUT 4182 TaxID=1051891 RepID=A0A0C3QQU2_9AGAM|nr:hypothetical protein M407DRAFT_159598 [Tulasnella calospora MUT 4182]
MKNGGNVPHATSPFPESAKHGARHGPLSRHQRHCRSFPMTINSLCGQAGQKRISH